MRYLLLVLICCISAFANAQSGIMLKGIVESDAAKTALPKASLSLKNGNKTVVRTISDKNGGFSFFNLQPGKFVLVTNYLGYKSDTTQVELKGDTMVMVRLANVSHQLDEVKIRSSVPPVIVKDDTLVFNTSAYKTKPYATLEELLKMLPGVVIDKDGNVTMNGQKIDKVMIDGKPFFINDPKKATKNLPTDIIAQVEVFKSESDIARKTGMVEPNSNKTINLKLKADKKAGYTGKAYAGTGTDDSYVTGGVLTTLDPKEMLSADASMNNINNQFTGTENNTGGAGAGSQKLGSINVNYMNIVNKKLTINTSLNYNHNVSSQQSGSTKQTFLADSSLLQNNVSNSSGRQHTLKAGIMLDYNPDAHYTVHYSFGWTSSENLSANQDSTLLRIQKGNSTNINSNGSTNNSNYQHSNAFENTFMVGRKFAKAGRALSFVFNQSVTMQSQESGVYTSLQAAGATTNKVVDQKISNPSQNNNFSATASYQEPLSQKIFMNITYNYSRTNNQSDKQANNFNTVTGFYDLPDTLNSDQFIATNTTHQLRMGISSGYSVKGKFRYFIGIGAQSASQDNNNLTSGLRRGATYYNFLPQADASYNVNDRSGFLISYQGMSQTPTLGQLQPLPDLSNPYFQKAGNPDLVPAFRHSARANYNFYNSSNFQNMQVMFQGDMTEHQISGATTTLPGGVQEIKYANVNGVYHMSAGVSYGFPLISQENGTGAVGTRLVYGHDVNVVDNEQNTNMSHGIGGDFLLAFHHGSKLFISCTGSIQYQANHYSLHGETNSKTLQQDYDIDLAYMLPFSFSTGVTYNYQSRKTVGLGAQQTNLLNAFIAKGIFKGDAAQVRLSGFNLLDAASSINQTMGANYIETTRTNTLHRLGLVSLVYNFSKFGKAK